MLVPDIEGHGVIIGRANEITPAVVSTKRVQLAKLNIKWQNVSKIMKHLLHF